MRHSILPASVMIAAVLGLGISDAAAQAPAVEQPLPVLPVELDLHDCRIDVDIADSAEPLLRVTDAAGDDASASEVEIRESGGMVRVTRTGAGGPEAATLSLELVLDATQTLRVRGQALSVTTSSAVIPDEPPRRPEPPASNRGDTQQPSPEPYSFDLVDSELHMAGTPAATINGINTVVHGENGAGDLSVTLEQGSLTLRSHRGSLHLEAWDSDCNVQDLDGSASFDVNGGNLELGDGSGMVKGKIRSGFLSLDRWTGDASLTGEDATVEVRDGTISRLSLTVSSTTVTIDGPAAAVTAQLSGGSVATESVRGSLDLTLTDDARAEIADHEGAVTLVVQGDSFAEVTDVDGGMKATVERSEATINNAESLELTARGARVSLAGVRRITNFDARDCELELDLREIAANRLDLRVVDGTDATVYLASPCRVQLRESASTSQQVDVTGCEFQSQEMGRWRGGQRRGVDGRPTFMLTAKVTDGAYLRVRGGP